MTALHNPRTRLLLAVALMLGLIAASLAKGFSASTIARAILVIAGLAGLAWWMRRRASVAAGEAPVRRLHVLDRTGLSPRCGLALVAIDGREFLVAYGDGFAEVTPTSEASSRSGPRPAPRLRHRGGLRGAR